MKKQRNNRSEQGKPRFNAGQKTKKSGGKRPASSRPARKTRAESELTPTKLGQASMRALAREFENEYAAFKANRNGSTRPESQPARPPRGKTAPAGQVAEEKLPRLQKVLAGAGVASRRECEKLIISGRVKVNGVVVRELGTRVDPEMVGLHVDGKPVLLDDRQVVVMLNKPEGVESTMNEGPNTLAPLSEKFGQRLYHVGRLDRDTTGLLLLTNNGELAHRLTHPSWEVPKTYLASVEGIFRGGQAKQLLAGVELEDGLAQCDKVSIRGQHDGRTLVQVTLHNGKNRIVRRMFAHVGHPVLELSRLSLGPLHLGKLKLGASRRLTRAETETLLASVGL